MLVLDTDIMVDVQRGFSPALEWLAQLPESPAITVITVLELLRGCRNLREQQSVERLLTQMPVLYLSESACIRAVNYFRAFHLSHGIGILDTLIAAIAVTHDAILCSFNEKHYQMVPDLQLMKPYSREQIARDH